MTDAAWLARIEAKLDALIGRSRLVEAETRLDALTRRLALVEAHIAASTRIRTLEENAASQAHRLDAMEAAWQDHVAAPGPPISDDNIPF